MLIASQAHGAARPSKRALPARSWFLLALACTLLPISSCGPSGADSDESTGGSGGESSDTGGTGANENGGTGGQPTGGGGTGGTGGTGGQPTGGGGGGGGTGTGGSAGSGGGGAPTGGSGGGGTGGASGGQPAGGGGTGGASGGTGGSGGVGVGGDGGLGGDTGSGGGAPQPPFAADECRASAGPTAEVLSSGIGAFSEDPTWMDGWVNWSLDSTPEDDGSVPTETLDADIDSDLELDGSEIYEIVGTVHVLDGATLTIPAGTLFKSDGAATLVISRGGRLVAEGTAEEPIVFTSQAPNGDKEFGQWGGIVILGNASNFAGPNVDIEGLPSTDINRHGSGPGAPIENQDSGSLTYVRIEFAGAQLDGGSRSASLTLGSVGSGTSIDSVAVSAAYNDGLRIFGGGASVQHFVVNSAGDDLADVDLGYVGTLDTFFGRQGIETAFDPNGFEWDGSLTDLLPATDPVAQHVTLCGVTGGFIGYGLVLREHVQGEIDDLAWTGFDFGLDLRDAVSPELHITGSQSWGHLAGLAAAGELDDDESEDEAEWFAEQAANVDWDL